MSNKGNSYRKHWPFDHFAEHWYCQHARLNQKRFDKKASKRLNRRNNKSELRNNKENYE